MRDSTGIAGPGPATGGTPAGTQPTGRPSSQVASLNRRRRSPARSRNVVTPRSDADCGHQVIVSIRHERFGQFLGCVLHVQGATDGAGGFAEQQQPVTGLVFGCRVDSPVRDRAQVSVVVSDRPESDCPRVGTRGRPVDRGPLAMRASADVSAESLQLTGAGGLLQQLTKRLLESALERERRQARLNCPACTCRLGTFSLRSPRSTAEVMAGGPHTYTSRSVMSETRAWSCAARTAVPPHRSGR